MVFNQGELGRSEEAATYIVPFGQMPRLRRFEAREPISSSDQLGRAVYRGRRIARPQALRYVAFKGCTREGVRTNRIYRA
jgi:hypothetical protein